MSSASVHIPVMVAEVLTSLRAAEGGDFLDCTLGGGGHTRALLEANPANRVTAIDRDLRAIERARGALSTYASRLTILHGSFSTLDDLDLGQRFDGMLADLGLSTDQLQESRGFSFGDIAALDMRMDEEEGQSAAEFLNTISEHELFVVLRQGGVGNEAKAIARTIVKHRPLTSAKELADVVAKVPSRKKDVHPATVVFQALRMAVNRELQQIEDLMGVAPRLVKKSARFSVITFHSLEDRAVTATMRAWEGADFSALWPGAKRPEVLGKALSRKPISASEQEILENPSARSARLRVFQFE